MRTTLALITLATSAALCTPVLAQEPGPCPPQGGICQPAPDRQTTETSARKVAGAPETQGYRDLRKVEPYGVKARNPKGRALKLYVDPSTARIGRPLQERIPGARGRWLR